jgi:hypothetical protein
MYGAIILNVGFHSLPCQFLAMKRVSSVLTLAYTEFVLQFPPLDGSVLMDFAFANNDGMYTAGIQATSQNLGWPLTGS